MDDEDYTPKMPKRSTNASHMSLEEIADIMGITRERVRQIEQRALQKLRKRLRLKGIKPEDLLGGMGQIPPSRSSGIRPDD
jgi:hypothetical protein